MKNRRESREEVFALLFEWSFKEDENMAEIAENAVMARGVSLSKFSHLLLETAEGNMEDIDQTIEKYSDNWKINRISRVGLASLRLALCELMYFEDIPPGATINEAVELAKKYGSDDDSSFVNGILGNYVRTELPDKVEEEI